MLAGRANPHALVPFLRRALSAAGVALLPLSIFAHLGMAPLFIWAALAVGACWIVGCATLGFPRGPATIAILLFLIVAAISILWAPRPSESIGTLVSLAATLGAGLVLIRFSNELEEPWRRSLAIAVVIGGTIGYGLLAFELLSDYTITRFILKMHGAAVHDLSIHNRLKPATTVGALFFWPFALALIRIAARHIAYLVLGASAIIILMTGSHSVSVVIAVSIAFALVGAYGGISSKSLGIAIAAAVLAMPWLMRFIPDPTQPGSGLEILPHAAVHRISIWHSTADLIPAAPWFGHGLDSSRAISGPEFMRDLVMLPDVPEQSFRVLVEPVPLHPHNLALQIWFETGAVGALLLAVILWSVIRSTSMITTSTLDRAVAFGAIGATLTVAAISYGAWQSWWLGTIFLISMFTLTSVRRP
jgi:exopolysaccharide production protein ExoQ